MAATLAANGAFCHDSGTTAARHSNLRLASRTTLRVLSSASDTTLRNASGELPTGTDALSASRFAASGCLSVATSAACTREVTSAGSLAGPLRPNHEGSFTSGWTVAAKVGGFGTATKRHPTAL